MRTSTGTFLGATSPYRSVLGAGSPRSQRRPGSSSSRRLGNNVPHAATDQGHSPKKPSFERNVVALSAASRVQATAVLGRDVAEISETDMEEQRAQVVLQDVAHLDGVRIANPAALQLDPKIEEVLLVAKDLERALRSRVPAGLGVGQRRVARYLAPERVCRARNGDH